MALFDLNPTTLDKMRGNTLIVKKDELEKFVEYTKDLKDKCKNLEEDNNKLIKQNKELKRKLNQKILDLEVGKDSKLSKTEKENTELKNRVQELENKYNNMEKMYLEKIKELLNETDKSITKTIKNSIREEFQNLEKPTGTGFEIRI